MTSTGMRWVFLLLMHESDVNGEQTSTSVNAREDVKGVTRQGQGKVCMYNIYAST